MGEPIPLSTLRRVESGGVAQASERLGENMAPAEVQVRRYGGPQIFVFEQPRE
jgi:hypothetical protein